MKKYYFKTIAEYNEALGLAPPEHPLICVAHTSSEKKGRPLNVMMTLSSEFYSVSLKKIISGEIFYGRTKYDCKNGTMIFTAPKQEIRVKGLSIESTGRVIVFHEDFIRGHSIKNEIKKYNYFSYAVNEALHLSPKEEQMMARLFDQIEQEYHNNQDEFSKELILSQLDTLLKYANRYYHRQFLHRKENSSNLLDKFTDEVEKYMKNIQPEGKSIPTIEDIASTLAMTPRYLSDALKVETGKTAIESLHLLLIDKAKDMLLGSDATVSTIAYSLGFEYPQYFSRLFKKKVGVTPMQYRNKHH